MSNCSDMSNLLSTADLFVLPSNYGEGLPKVLCEAAACGIPAVTTNIPGCCNAVDDNVTGFLVQPNQFSELLAAVEYLIDNPRRRQSMAKSARERAVKLFDINII